MRSFKLVPATILIMLSISVFGQELESSVTYYDYELIPTGEIIGLTDTVYKVYFTIDSNDLSVYSKVKIVCKDSEMIVSGMSEDITKDQRIESISNYYRIYIDECSGSLDWSVTGIKYDDSENELKNKKEKDKVNHVVISKPRTRDLEIATDTVVPEEELKNQYYE